MGRAHHPARLHQIEWHFVLDPQHALGSLRLASWPTESRLSEGHRRQPRPLASFRAELSRLNRRLLKLECNKVSEEELVAARLYVRPRDRAGHVACPHPQLREGTRVCSPDWPPLPK